VKARQFILTTCAAFAFVVPAAHASGAAPAAPANAVVTITGANHLEPTDVVTVVRALALRTGKYQVEVENTSAIGYINTFTWAPSDAITVTSITSSHGGSCHIANNSIICTASKKGIAPPSCTCRAGGALEVNFTATGNGPTFNGRWWTYYGFTNTTDVNQMTKVPGHVPSYVPTGPAPPPCDPGTQIANLDQIANASQNGAANPYACDV
jgi:hypothetical protein